MKARRPSRIVCLALCVACAWGGAMARATGGTLVKVTTGKEAFQGHDALFLENAFVRLTLVPALGGRLADVFDKTLGGSIMWWGTYHPRPGDEEPLNGGALDDRISFDKPYTCEIVEQTPKKVAVKLGWDGPGGIRIEKTVSLPGGCPYFDVDYHVTNAGHADLPEALWVRNTFKPGAKELVPKDVMRLTPSPRARLGLQPSEESGRYREALTHGWAAQIDPDARNGLAIIMDEECVRQYYFWTGSDFFPTFEFFTYPLPMGQSAEIPVRYATLNGLDKVVAVCREAALDLNIEAADTTGVFNVKLLALESLDAPQIAIKISALEAGKAPLFTAAIPLARTAGGAFSTGVVTVAQLEPGKGYLAELSLLDGDRELIAFVEPFRAGGGAVDHARAVPERTTLSSQPVPGWEPPADQFTALFIADHDGVTIHDGLLNKFPMKTPLPRTKTDDTIRISAARGEYEPFEIVLHPPRTLAGATAEVGALTGPGTIGADRLAWNFVKYLANENYQYFADPLMPERRFDCPAGVNTPLWCMVSVPRDAKPGVYAGTLTLSAQAGMRPVAIPLELTVWDFELPRENSCRTAYAFDTAFLSQQLVARKDLDPDTLLRAYMRFFAEHRVSPRYLPSLGGDLHGSGNIRLVNGNLVADFAAFDRLAGYCFDELGMNTAQLPGGQIGSQQNFYGFYGVKDLFSPEFERLWSQFVRLMFTHLREKGWEEKFYFNIWDEPTFESYAAIRRAATITKAAMPGVTIMVFSDYIEELKDVVDIFNGMDAKAARKLGRTAWTYNVPGGNVIDHSSMAARLVPVWIWKEQADGFLFWRVNFWRKDPWVHPNDAYASWFYYDPKTLEPVSSIRWAMMREGWEDYEYLVLAERLAAEAEKTGRADQWVRQAREASAAMAGTLTGGHSVGFYGQRAELNYTRDVMGYRARRQSLAQAIVELRRAVQR